jgi:hypothetical protein
MPLARAVIALAGLDYLKPESHEDYASARYFLFDCKWGHELMELVNLDPKTMRRAVIAKREEFYSWYGKTETAEFWEWWNSFPGLRHRQSIIFYLKTPEQRQKEVEERERTKFERMAKKMEKAQNERDS